MNPNETHRRETADAMGVLSLYGKIDSIGKIVRRRRAGVQSQVRPPGLAGEGRLFDCGGLGVVSCPRIAQCNAASRAVGRCAREGAAVPRGVQMWEIRAEREEHRYSAFLDGARIGHAAWVRVGDVVVVPHVYVDALYRSTGVESDLAGAICADAQKEGATVLASSVFLQRFAYRHPQYDKVLREPHPGEMALIGPLVDAAESIEEAGLASGWNGEAEV